MRSMQMVMFMLCVLGGLFLLTQGPAFFMPARIDPAIGLHFDAFASRLLGAGLLALAAVGGQYLRAMYYSEQRRLPNAAAQRPKSCQNCSLPNCGMTKSAWFSEPCSSQKPIS